MVKRHIRVFEYCCRQLVPDSGNAVQLFAKSIVFSAVSAFSVYLRILAKKVIGEKKYVSFFVRSKIISTFAKLIKINTCISYE